MERLFGFIDPKGYKIHVDAPTNIRDDYVGRIRIYYGRTIVEEKYFKCKKMPRRDVPLQAIILGRKDEQEMRKTLNKLISKLPDLHKL